jgi:hypothetical protein
MNGETEYPIYSDERMCINFRYLRGFCRDGQAGITLVYDDGELKVGYREALAADAAFKALTKLAMQSLATKTIPLS